MKTLLPDLDMRDLDDIARQVGVCKSVVEVWVYTDKCLPSFKMGKVRRVNQEDLVRFVLLNTLRARRPDWCTAAVESEYRRQMLETIHGAVRAALQEERQAA